MAWDEKKKAKKYIVTATTYFNGNYFCGYLTVGHAVHSYEFRFESSINWAHKFASEDAAIMAINFMRKEYKDYSYSIMEVTE